MVIESAAADARRTELGREVLGPMIRKFLFLLHHHLRYRAGDSAVLYVARAGVRIKELYELYCESAGLEPVPGRIAWTSRMLMVKGAMVPAPELAAEIMDKEFPVGTVADALAAAWRHDPQLAARIDRGEPALARPARNLPAFVKQGEGRTAAAARSYFEGYEKLVGDYVADLAGGRHRLVLVDSGWQGTIHRILTRLRPDLEIVSLLFGRVLRPGEDRSVASDLVGLILEADYYRPDLPESALIFHRHVVENLFEVDMPSVEVLVRDEAGRVHAPQSAELRPGVDTEVLAGVVAFLREHPSASPAEVFRAHAEAAGRLHDLIVSPDRADVAALAGAPRSADFGRALEVPVVMAPEDRFAGDSPDHRIAQSLWPQGQAALEYEGSTAERSFASITGGAGDTAYFDPLRARPGARRARPTVAIVTRTKDRPILLRRAAASVAKQTYDEYVWVVVNDGGNEEEVLDVIRASPVEQYRITLVSNSESVGMEAASNKGVTAVASDLVVIHDDDDSWEPDFLRRSVEFLAGPEGSEYGGVITHSTYVSEEIRGDDVIIHGTRPYNEWVRAVNIAEMAAGNFFPPIAFVFRRSVYERIGGFDELLPVLGDWDFNLRFLRAADIGVITEPLANYHHRDTGTPGWYGNSVIQGRDLHLEYNTILRNRMARAGSDDMLAISMLGYMLDVLRSEVRRVGASGPPAAASAGASQHVISPDELWMALTSVAHSGRILNRRNKIVRAVNGVLRKVFGVPTGDVIEDVESFAKELIAKIDPVDVPVAPDFDEDAYLAENRDVKAAVASGGFRSGYHHYIAHGWREGRRRPTRKPEGWR